MEFDAVFVVPWKFLKLLIELEDLVADVERVNLLLRESIIELLIESFDERSHVDDV